MATNFPTSLDTLTNPTSADRVDTITHSAQHANINDAVEALQAKVGADSSIVTTSHDYKLSDVTSTAKAVSTAGNQTIAGDKTFSGVISATSPALTTPEITTSINDANGNEIITTPATASAVNHVKITNAVTTADPLIEADGSDTNVGLKLKGKGTGQVKLGDAELTVPDSDGSNGQVLSTDGSGNLIFTSTSSSKFEVDTTEVNINNSSTETTLFSVSVPGGTLSTNNAIEGRIAISQLDKGSVRNLTLRLKYGSTTIATVAAGTGGSNFVDMAGFIDFSLVADGSTSAQKAVISGNLANNGSASDGVDWLFGDYGTATEDSTGALNLSVTAQFSGADVSDNLDAEYWVVKLVS